MIYRFEGHVPTLAGDGSVWIAPDANVIGQVILGELRLALRGRADRNR